ARAARAAGLATARVRLGLLDHQGRHRPHAPHLRNRRGGQLDEPAGAGDRAARDDLRGRGGPRNRGHRGRPGDCYSGAGKLTTLRLPLLSTALTPKRKLSLLIPFRVKLVTLPTLTTRVQVDSVVSRKTIS